MTFRNDLKPRGLCELAWQEIAEGFPDCKITKRGQVLKRVSRDKEFTFEISFQSNRLNTIDDVDFIPHMRIHSRLFKKTNINQGYVFFSSIDRFLGKNNFPFWNLNGENFDKTVAELKNIIGGNVNPFFHGFENTKRNVENILKLYPYYQYQDGLLYYIYFYAGKEEAKRYFNRIMREDDMKGIFQKYLEAVRSEKADVPLPNMGGKMLTFALSHGLVEGGN